MISEIYKKYFQKSFTFLYPLLGFKRLKHPRPSQTYICWEGTAFTIEKRKLICAFTKQDTEEWKNFEANFLVTHKMLEQIVPIDDTTVLYVFNLHNFAADFDKFLQGKYSLFSSNAKKLLTDYYGTHTPEWVYVESFLFPAKYFKQYADILGMEEHQLREVGELCDLLDITKETCIVQVPTDIEQFN
jgi:hypothetical protein